MKVSLRILGILLAVLFVISMGSCGETSDETVVDIPDAALRAAIASELEIQDDTSITVADMLKLTVVNASTFFHVPDDITVSNKVTNLIRLEYATNLKELFLDSNEIVDVSPLQTLTKLERLWLSGNPMSQESVEIHIPQLRQMGQMLSTLRVRAYQHEPLYHLHLAFRQERCDGGC